VGDVCVLLKTLLRRRRRVVAPQRFWSRQARPIEQTEATRSITQYPFEDPQVAKPTSGAPGQYALTEIVLVEFESSDADSH